MHLSMQIFREGLMVTYHMKAVYRYLPISLYYRTLYGSNGLYTYICLSLDGSVCEADEGRAKLR